MPSLPHTRFWPGGLAALRCVAAADRTSVAVYATIDGVAQEVSFAEAVDDHGLERDTCPAAKGAWRLVCIPEPFNGCTDILDAVLWTTPATRTVTPEIVTWAHMQTLLMLADSGGASPTGYLG